MIFKAPFSWTIGDKAITYPDCSHNSSLTPATSLELPYLIMCACALGKEGFMGSCNDLNSYSVLKTCNIAGNC